MRISTPEQFWRQEESEARERLFGGFFSLSGRRIVEVATAAAQQPDQAEYEGTTAVAVVVGRTAGEQQNKNYKHQCGIRIHYL